MQTVRSFTLGSPLHGCDPVSIAQLQSLQAAEMRHRCLFPVFKMVAEDSREAIVRSLEESQ